MSRCTGSPTSRSPALAGDRALLSFFDLVGPDPFELVATLAVLVVVCVGVDAAAQRVLRLPWRIESSLITAHILLFVLRPSLELTALAGIALAGAVASLSKYVLAWQGRHIFNPAAVGATVLTLSASRLPALGASSWWVGTPAMAGPVIVLGLAVLWRTEKVRVVAVFLVVAVAVAVLRTSAQYQAAGLEVDALDVLWQLLWSSPFLFLGAFMLSEPLTLPPRRWQQFTVAAVVGVLAGWPIDLGVISLGQERALLVGNLVAFAFSVRTAVKLTLESRADAHADGTRADLPCAQPPLLRARPVPRAGGPAPPSRRARHTPRVQHRLGARRTCRSCGGVPRGRRQAPQSSYKRALAEVTAGSDLAVTGVWGDFVLPKRTGAPVLMVAAGIGITPFVSQLRHARLARGGSRHRSSSDRPCRRRTSTYCSESGMVVEGEGVGEIVVKGRHLSRGYWGKTELTDQRFLPDPNGSEERMYHTGDLGYRSPDGCITHRGRKDSQVKIRGYRVELSEIELAILNISGVKEAVVVARDNQTGEKQLVAYVVAISTPGLSIRSLLGLLRQKLPDFMVPSAVVILEALPLLPNGKVDRQALPSPDWERPELAGNPVPPRGPIEAKLAEIWANVLSLKLVGVQDDFLGLGGHSLLATRVLSQVTSVFGVELTLRTFFDNPTIQEMARVITQTLSKRSEPTEFVKQMERLSSKEAL